MARRRREPETAEISSVTHDGKGIANLDGKKAFVAGALPGETVQFIRRKSRRNYDECELLEIIEASPDRIDARCEAFGRCGGCSLQHVTPGQQRGIKEQTLKDNLERIGRVEADSWLAPMTGREWNYRRRARLAVKHVPAKGRTLVGFRERHAPFITDMHRCEILAKPVDALIEPLSDLVGSLSIRARLPQIEVAVGDDALALVFRVLDPPSAEDRSAFEAFGRRHKVSVWLQPGGLDSLEPVEPDPPTLKYALPDFEIEIDFEPIDFVQVNADINRRMVARAIELLDPREDDRVLDLYCGIGNFSLPLARRSGSVLGIEGERTLVARAKANAERNGIGNAEFRCADLSEIDSTDSWVGAGWDRVLLDPARSGAAAVVEKMGQLGPERVVYVSCHPGTLARDAGTLVKERGYELAYAGIIDMFPHTAHVESVAVFDK